MSHDAIVIGAGVNGLVTAHLLARGGQRVLLLEQRADVDQAPETGWVPTSVIRELKLDAGTIAVAANDPWISVPLEGGGRLELSSDVAKSVEAIRRVSPADAAKWPEFCTRMKRVARVLEQLYDQPAPDVETRELGELLRLGRLGLSVRRMGRQGMIDLLRILPMSVADLLDEWFEHDALKGAIGAAGIMHLRQGPRSGGTAFNLLHHHVGAPAGVFRQGMSRIRAALGALPGVQIRHAATVERIVAKAGVVTGVVLTSGEELAAPVVVSSADPRATLLSLLEPGWLDPEFTRAIGNIKCRGVAARVTLKLERPVAGGPLAVAPSLTHLERAYDDAKYGRVSARPFVEAHPADHRLAVHVQYVPHTLREGPWDDARRDALGAAVIAQLEPHLPGLRQNVKSTDVLTPDELEERYGLTEGHAYHGELTLDQILFMRPVAGWSRYATPVGGLYLCGSGTHPGGGILGGPGRLAAREILRDRA